MKQTVEAKTLPDGSVEPAHEIDIVCKHCASEESAKTLDDLCSACGQPWVPSQSVNVFTTTLPFVNTGMYNII